MMELGCEGFEETDTHLICYLQKQFWNSDKHARLTADLSKLLRTISVNAEITMREIEDQNWNAEWEKTIQPLEVGDRLVITPSWAEYRGSSNRIIIQIDPKMSFGTGYHETTRLTLQLLEKYVAPDDRILDVGTGTGILAIAGIKLGAERATGIDIDEWSIDNSIENVAANNLTGRIVISDKPTTSFPEQSFTLLTANIILNTNLEMLPEFSRVLSPRGKALFSGLLKQDEPAMVDGLRKNRFNMLDQVYENEWVAIAAEKSA
jgi:ribosomal protein L11 methyltransferase